MALTSDQYDIQIRNTLNNQVFYFRGCSSVKPKKEQPVIPVSILGTTANNTLLFRFFGQQEKLNFTFTLFNDGTDMASGSSTSAITIQQQIEFLRNQIFTDEVTCLWQLWFTKVYGSSSITGVMIGLEFDLVGGSPSMVTGNLSFQRGRLTPEF